MIDRDKDRDEAVEQLLRLCLQSRWDPQALEAAQDLIGAASIDWEILSQTARASAIAPLLYLAVRDRNLLPAAVEQELRMAYLWIARRNTILLHELEKVLCHLQTEDVPVILLKGAALTESVYRNAALRSMGDIDLLVAERDVPAALRALTFLGYRVVRPLAYRNEVVLQNSEHTIPVEVHWSLFVTFYHQHKLSMRWFWETALPARVGETAGQTLGPEAQILHLCGHLLLHHSSGEESNRLWLYDVAAVVAEYGEQIDWKEVLARADAYGLILPLQRVLSLACEQWDAPVPPVVLERVRAMHPSQHEERVFGHIAAGRRSPDRRFWTDLASLSSWRARLNLVWRNLFPPVDYMMQVYGVPRRFLVVLYYPYRWLLGLWSAVAGRGLGK